jgi:hypothetical protein
MHIVLSAGELAQALGDAHQGSRGWWRCRCPVHGGVSLEINDGDRGLIAHCFGGCNPADVYRELRQRGYLSGQPPAPPSPEELAQRRAKEERERRRRFESARELWRESGADSGIIGRYLGTRGIALMVPPTIRLHPWLKHRSGAERPAMVSAIKHDTHGLVGVHVTFLARDGNCKAALEPNKVMHGVVAGGAVRLAALQPDQPLLVAEGLETALSLMAATGLPAWAALSAGGLKALVLPAEARTVVICADNDINGVGQRAARDAALRFATEGRRVKISTPPEAGTDFNDMLRREVRHVAAA